MLPSLLVPINEKNSFVRKAALILLKTCIDRILIVDSSIETLAFANISSSLCQASEIIVADNNQVPRVFATHYDRLVSDFKTKDRKSSRSKAATLRKAKENAMEASLSYIMHHVTDLRTPSNIKYAVLISLQQVNNTVSAIVFILFISYKILM